MDSHVYSVQFSKPMKVEGQYGPMQASNAYVVAHSYEEALLKFREKYPDCPVRGISMIDYFYGIPVIL